MSALALRLPRCLLDPRLALPPADDQGLVAVSIEHRDGRITALRPAGVEPAALPLALTPLVDAHVHLDKAFSGADFPNPEGTMAGALAANLRELEQRRAEQVRERAEQALERAWRYGTRALRSHVDFLGPAALEVWQALQTIRARWAGRVALQLVALAPLDQWLTVQGRERARRVAADGGLLGTVLGPPLPGIGWEASALEEFLRLAQQLGCPLDLHLDESDSRPARGLVALLRCLDRQPLAVPITCSHATSLSLAAPGRQRRLLERMARHELVVVGLPTTNLWLLGKRQGHTPLRRPQAPLAALQAAGVRLVLGGDNVQDPWFAGGDFDPVELLRLMPLLCHQLPWQRQGLALLSREPARLLELPWDGVLRLGGPADLLVLAARDWGELLARSPQRRVLRAGQWLPPPPAQAPSPWLAALSGAG